MTTQLSNAGEGDCLRDAHFNYIYMRLRHAPQYHDGLRQKRNYNRPLPTRRLRRPPYRSRSSARGFHRAGWKVRSVRLEAQDGLNVRSSARRNVPTSCFWNVLWNRPRCRSRAESQLNALIPRLGGVIRHPEPPLFFAQIRTFSRIQVSKPFGNTRVFSIVCETRHVGQ
jgi:hypothetical protein